MAITGVWRCCFQERSRIDLQPPTKQVGGCQKDHVWTSLCHSEAEVHANRVGGFKVDLEGEGH